MTPIIGSIALYFLKQLEGVEDLHAQKEAVPATDSLLKASTSKAREQGGESERPEEQSMMKSKKMWLVLKNYYAEIFVLICSLATWSPMVYSLFIWTPIYLSDIVEVSSYNPFVLNVCMLVIFVSSTPFWGYLMDILKPKYGHEIYRYSLASGSILTSIACVPAFLLLQQDSVVSAVVGYFFMMVPLCMYGSCMFIFCIEQFQVLDRLTGVGYAYNFSHCVWSSSITSVLTVLANDRTLTAPAFYLLGINLIAFLATTIGNGWLAERRRKREEGNLSSDASSLHGGGLRA